MPSLFCVVVLLLLGRCCFPQKFNSFSSFLLSLMVFPLTHLNVTSCTSACVPLLSCLGAYSISVSHLPHRSRPVLTLARSLVCFVLFKAWKQNHFMCIEPAPQKRATTTIITIKIIKCALGVGLKILP